MFIELPQHQAACHSIAVYDGVRYKEDVLLPRAETQMDISRYAGFSELRLVHSPATERDQKQPPEYRAIARKDGVWFPYRIEACNWGLPTLYIRPTPQHVQSIPVEEIILDEVQVTDPRPGDGVEAERQDDAQAQVETAESLTPAKEDTPRQRRKGLPKS